VLREILEGRTDAWLDALDQAYAARRCVRHGTEGDGWSAPRGRSPFHKEQGDAKRPLNHPTQWKVVLRGAVKVAAAVASSSIQSV